MKNVLRQLRTPSRVAWGLAAFVLVVTAGAGCGDDDSDSTTTPPDGPTTTSSPAPTPAAKPDLTITSVSVQPSGVVPPGEVQISATVKNIGAADYGNMIIVQAPGNYTGGINGLAAGASDVAVINFPVVSPNVTYTLSLVVDPDNVIAEESESNNESAEFAITTGP